MALREPRPFISDGSMLPSDSEDAKMTGTETDGDDEAEGEEASLPASDSEAGDQDSDSNEDEWMPPAPTSRAKPAPTRAASPSPTCPKVAQPKLLTNNRVSALAKEMKEMDLEDDFDADDSMIIRPRKSSKAGRSGPRKVKR